MLPAVSEVAFLDDSASAGSLPTDGAGAEVLVCSTLAMGMLLQLKQIINV